MSVIKVNIVCKTKLFAISSAVAMATLGSYL
jgi:hypothetical protein